MTVLVRNQMGHSRTHSNPVHGAKTVIYIVATLILSRKLIKLLQSKLNNVYYKNTQITKKKQSTKQ